MDLDLAPSAHARNEWDGIVHAELGKRRDYFSIVRCSQNELGPDPHLDLGAFAGLHALQSDHHAFAI
jgi:hypothetical protein